MPTLRHPRRTLAEDVVPSAKLRLATQSFSPHSASVKVDAMPVYPNAKDTGIFAVHLGLNGDLFLVIEQLSSMKFQIRTIDLMIEQEIIHHIRFSCSIAESGYDADTELDIGDELISY